MSNQENTHFKPAQLLGSFSAIFLATSSLIWGYFQMAGTDSTLPLNHFSNVIKISIGMALGITFGLIPFFTAARKELVARGLNKASENYFNLIKTPDFRKWQKGVLSGIYANKDQGIQLTVLLDQEYPVVTLTAEKNFTENYDKENIRKDLCFSTSAITLSKKQKKYLEMMRPRIKHPEVPGFSLKQLWVDENRRVTSWQAETSNYIENVATAHALEYELAEAYVRYRKTRIGIEGLPLRNRIHGGRSIMEVLTNPMRYRPQISVQGIILFTHKKTRCTIAVNRKENLAAKPGFRQIFPAGGFEAYSKDLERSGGVFSNHDPQFQEVLKFEYSLKQAFYREMMEEIFGLEQFSYNLDDEHDGVTSHELVKYIDGNTISFVCLGVVIDLVVLRHEFSFLLDLGENDLEHANYKFKESNETGRFVPMPIGKKLTDWITSSQKDDMHPLNPSTAGLLYLASKYKCQDRISILSTGMAVSHNLASSGSSAAPD